MKAGGTSGAIWAVSIVAALVLAYLGGYVGIIRTHPVYSIDGGAQICLLKDTKWNRLLVRGYRPLYEVTRVHLYVSSED